MVHLNTPFGSLVCFSAQIFHNEHGAFNRRFNGRERQCVPSPHNQTSVCPMLMLISAGGERQWSRMRNASLCWCIPKYPHVRSTTNCLLSRGEFTRVKSELTGDRMLFLRRHSVLLTAYCLALRFSIYATVDWFI